MHRDQIEALFYGRPENQRRFTQDFPILPDVWIEYGKDPAGRVEVLLTPHNESDAPAVARALRERLRGDAKTDAARALQRVGRPRRPLVFRAPPRSPADHGMVATLGHPDSHGLDAKRPQDVRKATDHDAAGQPGGSGHRP